MTNYQTQPANVEAEQWIDADASLPKIQRLIFPGSPLLRRPQQGSASVSPSLGVFVDVPGSVGYELQWAEPNDWIVKYPSGVIKVVKAKEFEELFVPSRAAGNGGDGSVAQRPSLADA